jgi:hypothetical protein
MIVCYADNIVLMFDFVEGILGEEEPRLVAVDGMEWVG